MFAINNTGIRSRLVGGALTTVLLIAGAGCGRAGPPAGHVTDDTLRVGFGLTSGQSPEAGIQQVANNIALEGLIAYGRDGRPQPWLAEKWSSSPDGLTWRIQLRRNVKFHNGTPLDAHVVKDILARQLPRQMGPAFDDIDRIETPSDYEVDVLLKRPTAFLSEALDVQVSIGE